MQGSMEIDVFKKFNEEVKSLNETMEDLKKMIEALDREDFYTRWYFYKYPLIRPHKVLGIIQEPYLKKNRHLPYFQQLYQKR